jgi:hypothetical protein
MNCLFCEELKELQRNKSQKCFVPYHVSQWGSELVLAEETTSKTKQISVDFLQGHCELW